MSDILYRAIANYHQHVQAKKNKKIDGIQKLKPGPTKLETHCKKKQLLPQQQKIITSPCDLTTMNPYNKDTPGKKNQRSTSTKREKKNKCPCPLAWHWKRNSKTSINNYKVW